MTAGSGTVCLVCNASIGVSTRKCCPIFEQKVGNSERTIVSVINDVLSVTLTEEDVHSNVVCKKCYKICNEIDEFEDKLANIKFELSSTYHKTLRKQLNPSPEVSDDTEKFPSAFQERDQTKRKRGRPPKHQGDRDVVSDVDSHIIELESLEEGHLRDHIHIQTVENEIIEIGATEECNPEYAENVRPKIKRAKSLDEDEDEDKRNYKREVKHDPEYLLPSLARLNNRKNGKKSIPPNSLIPKMVVSRHGDKYTCLLCAAENAFTSDSRLVISHLKEKHDIRLYICDVCGEEFFGRTELSKHLDDHVSNAGSYECGTCHRVFNNFRLFRVHKKMHNMPVSKNYTCELCGKRYGSRSLLEEHNNIHTGERPYVCVTCGKTFTSKYTLKAHEKTHVSRPRPYTCINCGKSFLTRQNLIHHERIHSGIQNYICQECGKSFNTARTLENHYVTHTGFKPHICRMCGHSFARKSDIIDHERTHSGEKPYQCEFCGSSFAQRSNLQAHKRTNHYNEKRYKCTDCGKAFKRRRLLDYHMKSSHTGERPFKCNTCEATFIYPEHFKKHKMIHTGIKPYVCEVCGKAFNSRDNRNAHRFIHSDKKPYECIVCGMGFMRKPLLYSHMNAAGHPNRTIVVNQPKLDDIVVPRSGAGLGDTSATLVTQRLELTVFTDDDGNERLVSADSAEHNVANGKLDSGVLNENNEDQHHIQIVLNDGTEYDTQHHDVETVHINNPQDITESVVTAEELHLDENTLLTVQHSANDVVHHYDETADLKTDDGEIQIVQIDEKQWLSLIQAEEHTV